MKNKIITIGTIIILMLISCSRIVYGTEILKDENELYKSWLELSDEEKINYIEPMAKSYPYVENETKEAEIPKRYIVSSKLGENLESMYKISGLKVKNQMNTTACWAFATTTMLESNIAKTKGNNTIELSPRHIDYATSTSFSDGVNENANNRVAGYGNFFVAMAYCVSGRGPVLESSMPFVNSSEDISINEIKDKTPVLKVEEYKIFPTLIKEYQENYIRYSDGEGGIYTAEEVINIRNSIKEHIMKYGAIVGLTNNSSEYYNDYKIQTLGVPGAYYCNKEKDKGLLANHGITIIGWDDNFSADNFNESNKPKSNGAYIVQDSYGNTGVNNRCTDGYYYISYDDCLIESNLIGVKKTEDINYSKIYQHDILGFSHYIEIPYSTAIFANVYERENKSNIDEILTEVSYMTIGKTNISIYVNPNGDGIENAINVGEFSNTDSGYYTCKINDKIVLTGDKYAIFLVYSSTENSIRVPLEYNFKTNAAEEDKDNVSTYWDSVVSHRGESFIVSNGQMIDLLDSTLFGNIKDCNFIIKGFTVEVGKGEQVPTAKPTDATSIPESKSNVEPTQNLIDSGNQADKNDENLKSKEQNKPVQNDNTLATRILPNAGAKIGLIIIMGIVVINILFLVKKWKSMKDIK